MTDDQGKEAFVSIQLTTPPKEPVRIDLSLSNTSYSKSLSSNLIFSPSDWSNEQKVTLQGIKKISKFFIKEYKPYIIGKISKNRNKVNLNGKINWL